MRMDFFNFVMRIISGQYGGRKINPPHTIKARPTTDFAKEALFNLLNNRIDYEGIDVLDLFAGTGSISYEFASRGARMVTSVELANQQQNFIRKTCLELNIRNINLVRGDVFKFIRAAEVQYDFIFADPPYALPQLPLLPDMIFDKSLLRDEGLFVLEHSSNNDFSAHPHFVEHRNYGNVNFSFFR